MKPAIFHSAARAELAEAIAFYNRQRAGLGLELLAEVEHGVAAIGENPLSWPVYRTSGVRRYLLQRFPYAIVYVDLEEALWIVAIAHGRRRRITGHGVASNEVRHDWCWRLRVRSAG